MTGGAGDDRYYVDDAGDQVTEAAGEGEGSDTIFSSVSYKQYGDVPLGAPLTSTYCWSRRRGRAALLRDVDQRVRYASAFAFSASNSACVIAPESSSSLALAMSAAAPPPAVSRT